MSNRLHIIFTCFYALFDIVFIKHNDIYVFVILVDNVNCVAIHDLSPDLNMYRRIEFNIFYNTGRVCKKREHQ